MLWPHVPHGQAWSGGPSQRLTCPTGCRVSTVNEQVARAFGEQGQGGQLEHPGHQAAGQQQGPGLRATQELPGETGEAGPAPPGQSPVASRARGQRPRSPVPPPSLWPYFSGFDLLLPQHSASLLCLTIGIAFGNPSLLFPCSSEPPMGTTPENSPKSGELCVCLSAFPIALLCSFVHS